MPQIQQTSPSGLTVTCSITTVNSQKVLLAKIQGGAVTSYFELNLQNFKNPSSTLPTDSFQIKTLDASSNLLDQQTSGIILTATVDSLTSASMFSSSSQVGKTGQDLTITLQIKNQIPTNGKIYVKFPYWNPDAAGTQYALQAYLPNFASGVTCQGVTNVAFNPTCTFDSSTQTLTLTSGFGGSSVNSGTTLSFIVKGFTNPITTQIVSGFQITTGDSSSGLIDSQSLTLQMSTVGQITSSQVKTGVTTVQELTQYRVEFMVPVPLSQGCKLQITFPAQIVLDPAAISSVLAFGLPSTQRTLSGTIDKTSNSYFVNNACPSYRDNTNTAIIYFNSITNPTYVMTTDSIEIQIFDSNTQMIVSSSGQGPKLTTTYGSLSIQSLSSDITQINSLSSLAFSFQPLHSLTADSKIVVYLPSVDLTVQSTCSLVTVSLLSQNAICSVDTSSNSFSITGSFNDPYTLASSVFIKFTVSKIKMPPSTASTGTIMIQTYTKSAVDNNYHLVDQNSATNLIQATSGLLAYGIITPTSTFANEINTYKIQFAAGNPILLGGYVIIDFPTQIQIPSPSTSVCSSFVNFQTGVQCSITSSSITIKNGFDVEAFTNVNQELSFSISGVKNPRSQQTTSSFKISTYGPDGSLIDTRSDQMTVTMLKTDSIATAKVTPSNYVVGSVNTYTFAFKSPTPLLTGDYLIVQFPTSLNQALSSTLNSCTGVSSNMANRLTCSINGAYGLKVRLSFSSSPLTSSTQFSFSVNSVANPGSGEPTALFQAAIYDSNMYLVNENNESINQFYVQMATGTQFPSITVSHQSQKPFVQTAFTFTFTLGNTLPANGQVEIRYPDQITVNTTSFACTVSLFGATPACSIDTKTQKIRVKQATNLNLAAGTVFSVTLQGLINSKFAKDTDSFAVQTLTADGYVINYGYNYLTVSNECDYPCYTCSSTSTSTCTSCDIDSAYSFLLFSQCVQTCPKGYYNITGKCLQCDSNCSECSQGAKNCTKCAAGLYNQGGTCLSSCTNNQYIQDSISMTCQPCQSPCATCSSKVNFCTSCLQNKGSPYLFGNFCYQNCPSSTYLLSDNQTCSSCDTNCQTCLNSANTCTSCFSSLKLNLMDNTCVTSCPPLVTTDTGSTCTFCDPTCKTCSINNPKSCQSCYSGLSLYTPSSSCIGQCPNGTISVTNSASQESVCQNCAAGCSLCQGTTDYCTKCDDSKGYLFFNFTCSTSCPDGYTRLNATKNVCVKINMDCPYGYAYNDYGQCELVFQQCQPGYVLNSDKTKCIPVPGGYAPIIFLIVCIGWTIFVIVKFRKTYSKIEMISVLLIFYTSIQTLIYLIMMALSLSLDFFLLKAFHVLTWVLMLVMNCTFFVFFHYRLRKQDLVFRHWYTENKPYYNIFKYLMLCFHFKMARLFYSKLVPSELPKWPKLQQHHKAFDAAFTDKYHTLIKPLFYVTVVNFIVQVVPIILMNIYGFVFILWGYQLVVMGIDHLILGLLIFILEIIEFTHYKKLAIEEGNLLQPSSLTHQYLKKINNDDNVMSVIEDNSMIGLNKYADDGLLINARDISLDDISKQIYNHEKSQNIKVKQSDEPQEKHVLEKLIRKIKEEQKFNRIYENDEREDEQQLHDDFYHDIEKIGTTKSKYQASLVPDQPLDNQPRMQPSSQLLETQPRV